MNNSHNRRTARQNLRIALQIIEQLSVSGMHADLTLRFRDGRLAAQQKVNATAGPDMEHRIEATVSHEDSSDEEIQSAIQALFLRWKD